MTVFADGFLAYHFEVVTTEGRAADIARRIKAWKSEVREQGTWQGFPQTLIDRLRALDGVMRVECEGPQSSLLIPLRMVRGFTGGLCVMSTTLGSGAITDAVETGLEGWGVETTGRRLDGVDMPLEFSVRESGGQSESVRLYPASRSRYRSQLALPDVLPDQFLCNRHNKGISALAESVAANGGLVSFRPRELGQHDRIDDFVSLLAYTLHVILSSRHRMLRQFANFAGISVPRGWPSALSDLVDKSARELAGWLLQRMPEEGVVVFWELSR